MSNMLQRIWETGFAEATFRVPRRRKKHLNCQDRVFQACKACASAKLKCNDEKPCGRCLVRGIQCESGQDGLAAKRPLNVDVAQTPAAQNGISISNGTNIARGLGELMETNPFPTPNTVVYPSIPRFREPDNITNASQLAFHGPDVSDLLQCVMTPSMECTQGTYNPEVYPFPDFGPRNVLDFTVDTSLDFDDADFSLLDQLNGNTISLELADLTPNTGDLPSESLSETPRPGTPGISLALGKEAFKRSSLGRWLPTAMDHCLAEFNNIALPTYSEGSPDARLKLDRRCIIENVHRNSRDKVLALILRACEPQKIEDIVTAFPSAELLDDLVQSFFLCHCYRRDSFIHMPTFNPNLQPPLLLAAIIAYGATLTGMKVLQKLGFAIQEAIRLAIPKLCEESNGITRELWLLQSSMCKLEIGLWSGNTRKMEIAESLPQILYTMLRRAGKFQRSKGGSLTPCAQDTGEVLHEKWLRWVEQESYSRLVYHAFIYDAASSMSLLVNPLICYTEISVALLESRHLWLAENAMVWKSIYLQRLGKSTKGHLTLLQCLQEPLELADMNCHYDVHFFMLVVLHAFWGIIWECLHLLVTTKTRPGHTNATLTVRHCELSRQLKQIRVAISDIDQVPFPETILMLHLLMMYMHISMEEIQLFAGKEDQDQARRVLPFLQHWVDDPTSRQALWHAGQVLRTAKTFPPGTLSGFYAVAVYHASLALWAYAVIPRAKPMNDNHEHDNSASLSSQSPVLLDGLDSPEVQRFITLKRGEPSIQSVENLEAISNAPISVSDTEGIMNNVVSILQKNHSTKADNDSGPPLVENLIQLICDLGRAGASITE